MSESESSEVSAVKMSESSEVSAVKMSESSENSKVFCDPVHGHIVLDPILVKIIDTPQFQRLRNIKQLGGKYFVYPGASHNRFEHSLGVAHLAGKLVEKIRAKQPELGIEPRDVLCVKIAGLCHDLGHGPFSHVWDGCVLRDKRLGLKKKWKHEEGSIMMLDHLIEQNGIMEKLMELDLYRSRLPTGEVVIQKDKIEQDIKFIKELINGPLPKDGSEAAQPTDRTWPYKGRKEDKSFLYDIIANKRNEIDVDKWDYFKRDCHHLGITCIFDIDRAMEFIRVIKPTDGLTRKENQYQICFRDKEARNLYQMFQTRELLHRMAYQHKTARAVEIMLTEALVLANETLLIPGGKKNDEQKKMSECHRDPYAYTNLTDHVFHLILTSESTDEKMQKAKEFLDRIQKRDLYRYLGKVSASDYEQYSTSGTAKTEIAKFSKSKDENLTADDLCEDPVTFDHGKKEKDPFEFIRFFSKKKPHEAKKIPLREISSLLPGPGKFQERMVRIYCKKSSKREEARRCFEEWEKERALKSRPRASSCSEPITRTNTDNEETPVKKNRKETSPSGQARCKLFPETPNSTSSTESNDQ